jgi:hypothetical protein
MRRHRRLLNRLTGRSRWGWMVKTRANGRRVLILWNTRGGYTGGRAWA